MAVTEYMDAGVLTLRPIVLLLAHYRFIHVTMSYPLAYRTMGTDFLGQVGTFEWQPLMAH